ncbi:Transposable element P transposase [Lucilia cuprina]|nr:Transposable element P transposase [Lucilia cuprina]
MKCAVGKCKQSNSIKTNVTQRDSWIKFCNRVRPINVQKEKICALHFKKEDFERNLKFELGYSQRRTPKLKPGAVPTIEACDTTTKIPNKNVNVIPNGNVNTIPITTEACEDIPIKTEIELGDEEITPMTTTIKEDNLQEYIKTLEMYIDVLCKENDELKILQNKSTIIIKKLTRQVQSLSYANVNLENSLKRMFTKDQIKKLKKGDKRQNFSEEVINQSMILYSTSAKAYMLLRKRHFPLPSVRTLQRWSRKQDMLTDQVYGR